MHDRHSELDNRLREAFERIQADRLRYDTEVEITNQAALCAKDLQTSSGCEAGRLGLLLARPLDYLKYTYPDKADIFSKAWHARLKKIVRIRAYQSIDRKYIHEALIMRARIQGVLSRDNVISLGRGSPYTGMILKKDMVGRWGYMLVNPGSDGTPRISIASTSLGQLSLIPIPPTLAKYIFDAQR